MACRCLQWSQDDCSLTCLCQVAIKERVKTGVKGQSKEQLKKYPSALKANNPEPQLPFMESF